ncbi:hypothetical protein D3C72_1946240 [compost metagenome]
MLLFQQDKTHFEAHGRLSGGFKQPVGFLQRKPQLLCCGYDFTLGFRPHRRALVDHSIDRSDTDVRLSGDSCQRRFFARHNHSHHCFDRNYHGRQVERKPMRDLCDRAR